LNTAIRSPFKLLDGKKRRFQMEHFVAQTSRFLALVAIISVVGCATTVSTPGAIKDQMGSQSFHDQNIGIAGGSDAEILTAVESAVSVAQSFQFHYDASASANGRVVVRALWQGRPVTLTMRFFRKDAAIYIASALSQPGDVAVAGGGQKIEDLFYSSLATETARRGLRIFGDQNARP
jgi:hypothetical protein